MNGRLTDDIGGAFGMGALGGGLWHTYRGLKNSPKGYKIAGTLEVKGPVTMHSLHVHVFISTTTRGCAPDC
jgi:hypothetical protein